MIAVDTNVIVRLLVDDDPTQAAVARALFTAGPIWIAKTVLLETAWVLRSLYTFDESDIREAFAKMLGLDNVQVDDGSAIVDALALSEQGLELADAIHLTSRPKGIHFASFDRSFVKRAQRAGAVGVSELPSENN